MDLYCWDIGQLNPGCIKEQDWLEHDYQEKIDQLIASPRRSKIYLKSQHYIQIKGLLYHAFTETPFYQNSFASLGVGPEDFKSLDDLSLFPILEKSDFLNSGKFDHIAQKYIKDNDRLFRTRTCGTTSGQRQFVYFDKNAIIDDSLQAVQQLKLQQDPEKPINESGGVVHYYVNPWWSNSINGSWRTQFIKSSTEPKIAARQIKDAKPKVLCGYPSDIRRLIKYIRPGDLTLKLIITNSEFSTRTERDYISAHFGCRVLDEYSSEELTRIALEMPDGGYYVNHDSVYLEVLDPITREPTPDGEWGEAVITGLLNKAMPYIRYASGDWVKKTPDADLSGYSKINWQRLDAIGGRIIDSLVKTDGSLIPQNIILDKLDHRAIEDLSDIADYRIYQKDLCSITIAVRQTPSAGLNKIKDFVKFAKSCLLQEIGTSVNLEVVETEESLFDLDHERAGLPRSVHSGKKRRRVRFLGEIKDYMKQIEPSVTRDWERYAFEAEPLNASL